MRTLRSYVCALCIVLTEVALGGCPASGSTHQFAQAVSPALQPTSPKPPSPPKSGAQPKQAPLSAKSAVPTTEEEKKRLEALLAKREAEIKDLNARLDRVTKLSNSLAEQIGKLNQQIGELTKRGGSLVRAYCETRTLSRNTAGEQNDCATSGYACEPVSGLCRVQCANSSECAPRSATSPGYVCDRSRCVRAD